MERVNTALRRNANNDRALERNSKKMAEIAKIHHEQLQSRDNPELKVDYGVRVRKVLDHITVSLTDEQAENMNEPFSEGETSEAIKSLKNGKAVGLDGILHDVWKELMMRYNDSKKDEPCANGFNIVKLMTQVFNDIRDHGIVKGLNFAEGWLCPLYKKGDRTDIGNYRPITVLNTDYKIMTKVLATRLGEVAPSIIHPSQAGFMKGRKIKDQTELAQLMTTWCKMTGTNGMIVCLDQEKAYDRILHPFLWATLKQFKFPKTFVDTIQALYSDAFTRTIVNGEISDPFKVTRGVCQGDPLSCLLFNLAIESLAQILRDSKLKGLTLGDSLERLIKKMFADDTTVYLAQGDSFKNLQKLLRRWCKASGANFNLPKTVAIPVGLKSFWENLIACRELIPGGRKIPDDIKILSDGEATHLLGAFVGNGIDNASVWTPTIEKVVDDLKRWEKGKPTLGGR